MFAQLPCSILSMKVTATGNVNDDPVGGQNVVAEKEPIPASLPWGKNVVAKVEPSPAILPGGGDGLRLAPIAAAAFNALETRNCEHLQLQLLRGFHVHLGQLRVWPPNQNMMWKKGSRRQHAKTEIEEVTPGR